MSDIGDFTPRAQQVLALAHREADRLNHSVIDTEHLLLGVLRLGQGVAFITLGRLRVDLFALREELGKRVVASPPCPPVSNIPYSAQVTKVLALGGKERSALNHTYFGTEHILLGLVGETEGVAGRVLRDFGVDLEKTRMQIMRELDPVLDREETKAELAELQSTMGAVAPLVGPTPSDGAPVMLSNFTPRALQVLGLARKEADRFGHNFVGSEHLLLGLIRLRQGVAANVLKRLGLDIDSIRSDVERQVGAGPDHNQIGNIPYTPLLKKVLAFAAEEAKALSHTFVGTEHVLLGLLRVDTGVAARVLKNFGVDLDETRREVLTELAPTPDLEELKAKLDSLGGNMETVPPAAGPASLPNAPAVPPGKPDQPKGVFKRIIHSIDAFVFDLAASQAGAETLMSFTPRAQQVLGLAREEAVRLGHNFVGTEHLLLGLIRLRQGVAVNVLKRMGLDLDSVRSEVERQVGTGPDQNQIGNIPYTPRVKKVLALAGKEAKALNHTYVGTEHILLGLRREGEGVAGRVLKSFEVNLSLTRHEIVKELDPFQAAREQVWPLARQQSASMDKPTAPPIIHTMKLGIINSAFQQVGMKTVTGLEHVKRIGFDTVDIFTEAMGISPEEVSLVARTCERLDLPIVSLPVVSVGLIDFNEPVREFHVGRTKQFIDLAKTWGAKNVLLVLGEYIWQREVIPAEAQWQCGIETCRRLGEYADKQGIDIALELEPFRLSLLNNVDSMVRFIDECNHPRVRANIDISHLVLSDTSPADVGKLKDRAIHVHISDCDGKVHGDLPPGRGVVKFEPYLQAIKELKIDGVVSIELEYSPDPERIVEWVEEAYRETAKRMEQAGLRS